MEFSTSTALTMNGETGLFFLFFGIVFLVIGLTIAYSIFPVKGRSNLID